MSSVIGSLGVRGKLMVVDLGMDQIQIPPLDLTFRRPHDCGACGASIDS